MDEYLRNRLATAYGVARRAGEGRIANVSIVVGQDVWDALLEIAESMGAPAPEADVTTLWGYPLILEPDWIDGSTIHVRTTEVIA